MQKNDPVEPLVLVEDEKISLPMSKDAFLEEALRKNLLRRKEQKRQRKKIFPFSGD